MRPKRDDIKIKIVEFSKKEFLRKGFRRASLRDISKNIGCTTGTIYTYFRNKDEILEFLVAPVIQKIESALNSREISFTEVSKSEHDLQQWFTKYIRLLIDLIKAHPVEMQLLFIKSDGSKYENYKDQLVEIGKERGMNNFKELKRTNQFADQPLSTIFIHNLVNFVFNSVLEILKTDNISVNEIKQYEQEIGTFLFKGWKGLIKI